MPKKVAEECMFCGEIPCACGKADKPSPPPKTRAKRELSPGREQQPKQKTSTAASKPEPTPVKRNPSILGAMRSMAKEPQNPAPGMVSVQQPADTALSEPSEKHSISPELAASLRAMECIMHPSEKVKYADVLRSEPSLEEKRVTWQRLRAFRSEMEDQR